MKNKYINNDNDISNSTVSKNTNNIDSTNNNGYDSNIKLNDDNKNEIQFVSRPRIRRVIAEA